MRKGGRNMTKYCPTCGRALPDEARHCDFCGTRQPARNTDFSAGRHNYISTRTFGAAVDIAAVRNHDPYREWSYRDAPEVDGLVFIRSERELITGNFVSVSIDSAKDYDLIGDFQHFIEV